MWITSHAATWWSRRLVRVRPISAIRSTMKAFDQYPRLRCFAFPAVVETSRRIDGNVSGRRQRAHGRQEKEERDGDMQNSSAGWSYRDIGAAGPAQATVFTLTTRALSAAEPMRWTVGPAGGSLAGDAYRLSVEYQLPTEPATPARHSRKSRAR